MKVVLPITELVPGDIFVSPNSNEDDLLSGPILGPLMNTSEVLFGWKGEEICGTFFFQRRSGASRISFIKFFIQIPQNLKDPELTWVDSQRRLLSEAFSCDRRQVFSVHRSLSFFGEERFVAFEITTTPMQRAKDIMTCVLR